MENKKKLNQFFNAVKYECSAIGQRFPFPVFRFPLFLFLFLSCPTLTARAADRALVVGVDVYGDTRLMDTPGATDDARAMRKLLIEKMNFPAGSVKILLNQQATAADIVQTFQTWLINQTRPGDRVFFSYAGHGFQVPDDNGDEQDGTDEAITPYDVVVKMQGGKIVLPDEKTFIRDDKFNDFIAQLSGRRAVLLFDSCHSGTISRGAGNDPKALSSRYLRLKPTRGLPEPVETVVPPVKTRDLSIIKEKAVAETVSGVAVFSAASPYQQAFPVQIGGTTRGAFSYLFESLVRRNPSETLDGLKADLKIEMKRLGEQGLFGKNANSETQVPQLEILSKIKIDDKPLFASVSAVEDFTAAAQSALFNPISTMRVNLSIEKNRYKIGETINYAVDVGETSYLYILVFSNNNQAFCIFPTALGSDPVNRVKPGTYAFPRGDYTTEATEPAGKDVWVALVSKTQFNLGEKQNYTWDEVFSRIGLEELQKAIVTRVSSRRDAGNRSKPLAATDWQAATVVIETAAK